MIVLIRQAAYDDLRHIRDWIAKDNPLRADGVLDRIFDAIDRLAEYPGIGHEGRASGTFEWVVVGLPYVVVYKADAKLDELDIVAVFHGARERD